MTIAYGLMNRILAKVEVRDDGCWIWQAHKSKAGYAKVKDDFGRQAYAHRLTYELSHGPVPDGLQLDHLCRNTSCVNPEHLEAVTAKENVRRSHVARGIARRV